VRAVFRELLGGMRAAQQPMRVAYLGPEYSYSHLAAIHRFGQSVELVPVASIAAVFEEVSHGQADFGLVPMENSTDGRVSDTLEMFARSTVRICGEVPLRIHHHLLGRGARGSIHEVVSKPQALSQCRNWIARHLPGVTTVEVASTSEAARRACESPGTAAIASLQAGVNYHLDVLARNIEDNPGNLTRFAVIGHQAAERTGEDKTALLFEIPHQPGSLADAMAVFKRSRLNMTWIESFPVPNHAGRYWFFVEFVGHQDDLRARRAIAVLGKKTLRLDVLGSFARMEAIG
jgi:chorismate mutase/prephenate dehydratase